MHPRQLASRGASPFIEHIFQHIVAVANLGDLNTHELEKNLTRIEAAAPKPGEDILIATFTHIPWLFFQVCD
jgi:hypothetical protein